jgi:hypothetical protein
MEERMTGTDFGACKMYAVATLIASSAAIPAISHGRRELCEAGFNGGA